MGMYTITYSLRDNRKNSDQYYNDIALFTDEVLVEASNFTGPVVESYRSYNMIKNPDKVLSHEEYTLELLVMGVLWKIYSGDALGLDKTPGKVLTSLAKLRQQGGYLKPGIDFVRGILSTIFLSPDLYDNMFSLPPMLKHLEKLLEWMDATGEFKNETKRLRLWQEFLSLSSSEDASDSIAAILTMAQWFEERSEEILGHYTSNVDRYLNEIRPKHYWQEDVIFCGRRRVEYHLNMVGAEIMNRAFRKAFLDTGKKMVAVPACMRIPGGDKCKALPAGSGLLCKGCTPLCNVNTLTLMGKENNFDVVIIPHESSLYSRWKSSSDINEDVGVIGIACILNLISGGLMLKEANIPAQCVLLDYCGCKKHWHHEGIPTEININYLKKILNL
jgi:hypothetical protein